MSWGEKRECNEATGPERSLALSYTAGSIELEAEVFASHILIKPQASPFA